MKGLLLFAVFFFAVRIFSAEAIQMFQETERPQIPATMSLKSKSNDTDIGEGDIVLRGNPFAKAEGTVFLAYDSLEKFLEDTDLDILTYLFTPDGIDVPVEPLIWNTGYQCIINKVFNGDVVVGYKGLSAAFTIKTGESAELSRIISQSEYMAFSIRTFENADFKMAFNFYAPQSKKTYPEMINFGNLVGEDSPYSGPEIYLVVIKLDEFRQQGDILLSVDFRLAMKKYSQAKFASNLAATISNICFIGKADSE